MKTVIIAVLATLAFATSVSADTMRHPACAGSTFTPHGVWDCR